MTNPDASPKNPTINNSDGNFATSLPRSAPCHRFSRISSILTESRCARRLSHHLLLYAARRSPPRSCPSTRLPHPPPCHPQARCADASSYASVAGGRTQPHRVDVLASSRNLNEAPNTAIAAPVTYADTLAIVVV